MAEYDVDVRKMNKTALAMLKSCASIDKSLKKSFKTKVKTKLYHNSNDSVDGNNSLTSSVIYSQISASASSIKSEILQKPHFVDRRNSVEDTFNSACWEVFNRNAVCPGGIPFDGCELVMPIDKIGVALHELRRSRVIKGIQDEERKYSESAKYMLSWTEFKEFIQSVLVDESAVTYGARRYSHQEGMESTPSTAGSDSFRSLVQQQRMASSATEIESRRPSIPMDLRSSDRDRLDPGSPSAIRLSGKIVPSHCVKDAMVDVLTKRDRQSKHHSLIEEHSQINFDDSGILRPGSHVDLHSQSHSSLPENDSLSRLSACLQKTTVSQLCNPDDEYYHKWKAMKQKRDARIDSEFKRKSRQSLIHNFQRAVHSSERNDLVQSLSEQRLLASKRAAAAGEEARRRREQFDAGMRKSLNALAARKAEESRFIRETLRSSVSVSRAMRRDEVQQKRLRTRELAPFSLDASSSTIIDIPSALVTRVKTAKSLLAYEAAKQEVKSFYETTLSDRLNHFAKSKEFAAKKVALACSEMTVTSISADELFIEEDLGDSESLAIREYYRHRGVQGSILEEDSARNSRSRHSKGSHVSSKSRHREGGSGTVSSGSSIRGDQADDNKSWISEASWAAVAQW